ncbi:MAG: hypothetical protein Kow00108_20350 [Calditrichia bacterium]
MNRFISLFESTEHMKSQLIWIPTLYQLLQKLQEMGLTETDLLKIMFEKKSYAEHVYYAALKLTEEMLGTGRRTLTDQ